MNAIEILKKDHKEIRETLQMIEKSKPTAIKNREKLIDKLHKLITLHTKIEEKFIYPLGLKDKKLESTTREAYEEHNAVDMLIKKALKVEVTDEYWLAKCTVIKENLEHHIKEEEENMFPALEKILSEIELAALGNKIISFKTIHIIK